MNFKINFSKLIDMLLPPMLRQKRIQEYLKVASKPIDDINKEFVSLVDEYKNELSFEPQTMLIEQRLNEQFGVLNKIVIDNLDKTKLPPVFIGRHNDDLYLTRISNHQAPSSNRIFISRHNQYAEKDVDFKVIINSSWFNSKPFTDDDLNILSAITKRYTPFGKIFKIEKSNGELLFHSK